MSTGFTPAPTVVEDEGESSEFITILGVLCGVFFFLLAMIILCCWRLRTRVSPEGRAKAIGIRKVESDKIAKKERKEALILEHERLQREDPFYADHLALDMLSTIDGNEPQGDGGLATKGLHSVSEAQSALGDPLLPLTPARKGGNKPFDSDDEEDDDGGDEFLRRWEEEQMDERRYQEELDTQGNRAVPEEKQRSVGRTSVVRQAAVTRNRPKGYIHPVELGKIRQKELYENLGKESYQEVQERLAFIEAGKNLKPPLPLLPFLSPEVVNSTHRPLAGVREVTGGVSGEVVHDGFHRLHGAPLSEKRMEAQHPVDFGQTALLPPIQREKKLFVDL